MEKEKEQLATPLRESRGQSDTNDLRENAAPASGDAGAESAGSIGVETPAKIEKLKEEVSSLYDRLLRKQAELDNFRKRTQRERGEFRQIANEGLIRELLPVLDGFERALKQRDPAVPESFYKGMELLHRQLNDVLARAGLEAMETAGQLFDPHFHQAVETVEDPGRRDQEIVEELQRGYTFNSRLLRPAIVRVAVNPKGALPSAEDDIEG
ncbi:MAG: nucleotide exchange factor GrpE [Terriglobia bacterium]|jgi:molecular chaperone GrpE